MNFLRGLIDKLPFSYWWIVGVIGAFFIFGYFKVHQKIRKRIHDYFEDRFVARLKYALLEVKIPSALEKTPLAMEQFFAGLHGTAKGVTWFDREIKGHLETTYSVEVVSIEGDIHFYVRTERQYRNAVESLLYAQFPDVEIQEVEDYVQNAPPNLLSDQYKMAGAELILDKPDPYPIRTYRDFEIKTGDKMEYVVDPFAAVLEAMNAIGEGEQMWAQYLFGIPMFGDWREDGRKIADEIMGRKVEKSEGFIMMLIREILSFGSHIQSRVEHWFTGGDLVVPQEEERKEEKGMEMGLWKLSPGEQETVKAIERNISKLGFYTTIRLVYFAPKELFKVDKASTLIGAFYQFNERSLNSFAINKKIGYTVRGSHFWKYRVTNYYLAWKFREIPWNLEALRRLRMREIYNCLCRRVFGRPTRGHKGFIFNTEELATIFHFPLKSVLTPRLPKIEARRGGPPARLPME